MAQDGLYQINTTIYGELLFKGEYNAAVGDMEFKTVNRDGSAANIYQLQSTATYNSDTKSNETKMSSKNAQLSIFLKDVIRYGQKIGIIENNKISKNHNSPDLSPHGVFYSVRTVKNTSVTARMDLNQVVRSIADNPEAVAFYMCAEATIPFIVVMANIVKVLTKSQSNAALMASRVNLQAIFETYAGEELMAALHKTFIMKLIMSPWFSIVLPLVFGVIGGVTLGAGIVAGVILAVIVALAFIIYTLVMTQCDGYSNEGAMEAKAEELGIDTKNRDDSNTLNKLYHDLEDFRYKGTIAYVTTISLNVLIAPLAVSVANYIQILLEKKEMSAIEGFISLMQAAGTFHAGLNAIMLAIYRYISAGFTYEMEMLKIKGERWIASEKFFGELLKRMEESLKNLLQSMQDYIKLQEQFVREIANGALSIVRGMTSV
ncbi:MAG: hypothetical protein LBI69_04285 [Puniceicoccales bacterium]|jgi:hypothetical protein|nr:hypothetical protein [Puniceicoccales bacterium]